MGIHAGEIRGTLLDVAFPRTRLWQDALWSLGGSALISLSAHVALRLPFTPVPVTTQTLIVLLTGAVLGRRRGAATMMAYLLWGALGFPVFAGGGSGSAWILGPTGGYLMGFPAAAWIIGFLCERGWDRRLLTSCIAMALGHGVIYLCGVTWLAGFVGLSEAFRLGVVPFVLGDVLKLAIATASLPLGWKIMDRMQ